MGLAVWMGDGVAGPGGDGLNGVVLFLLCSVGNNVYLIVHIKVRQQSD